MKNMVRWTPKASTKVADKKSDAVAYLYLSPRNGALCAVIYYGQQSKPAANYRYRNEAERAASVRKYFESRQAYAASVAKRAAERKATVNTYKIGDVFRTCWGYDQTNVEWFEVVATTAKTVTVREICAERVSTGWEVGKCVPVLGAFAKDSKPKVCRVNPYGGIRIDSVRYGSFVKPTEIAGVKVYDAASWSSYA